MGDNLGEYRFVFNVKSANWSGGPGWKQTKPVTLAEILDFGPYTQLEYTDGGHTIVKDLDWGIDEIVVAEFQAVAPKAI